MKFFSYIDPGTGSLFIQAILGAVLAGGVLFRNFFRHLFAKLKRKKTTPTEQPAKDDKA